MPANKRTVLGENRSILSHSRLELRGDELAGSPGTKLYRHTRQILTVVREVFVAFVAFGTTGKPRLKERLLLPWDSLKFLQVA